MYDSDLEASEINKYKIHFDHNDSGMTNTHAAIHNVGNVEQRRKFTDFIKKNTFFLILAWWKLNNAMVAQLASAVEYTNCFSAKG